MLKQEGSNGLICWVLEIPPCSVVQRRLLGWRSSLFQGHRDWRESVDFKNAKGLACIFIDDETEDADLR